MREQQLVVGKMARWLQRQAKSDWRCRLRGVARKRSYDHRTKKPHRQYVTKTSRSRRYVRGKGVCLHEGRGFFGDGDGFKRRGDLTGKKEMSMLGELIEENVLLPVDN